VPQRLDELYAEIGANGPRGTRPTSDPAWLDERPGAPPPQIRGQLQMPTNPDPLPLLTKAATGVGLLGLLYGMDHWARPMLKATRAKQPTDLVSLLETVIAALTRWVNPRMRYMTHAVSKGAAHTAASPAWMFGVLGLRWTQVVGQLMYLGHDLAYAFERLRHTVIPREINRKVNPLRVRVGRVEKLEKRDYRQLTGLRVYTHRQVERIIKPRIRRVERKVTHDLPLRIHREEIKRGRLENRVKHDEGTLRKLLPLLTVTGAVALVLRAFTRMGLNFLRCRNFKDVGRDICASPPGSGRRLGRFLKNILSMGAGILFASQFCHVLFLVLEGAAPVASKLVETLALAESALCNGKYAAAPPLPLNATALPPVPNPLDI
jgi:hypothetical protein